MDVSNTNCWSCGGPGVPVGGHSWLRQCRVCDVAWDTQPAGSAAERDRVWQKGNSLDKIAEKYGLGNRSGMIDHATVKLSSPG